MSQSGLCTWTSVRKRTLQWTLKHSLMPLLLSTTLQRLSQDNQTKQRRAWLLLGWATAERSCPCKQLAWKAYLSRWSPDSAAVSVGYTGRDDTDTESIYGRTPDTDSLSGPRAGRGTRRARRGFARKVNRGPGPLRRDKADIDGDMQQNTRDNCKEFCALQDHNPNTTAYRQCNARINGKKTTGDKAFCALQDHNPNTTAYRQCNARINGKKTTGDKAFCALQDHNPNTTAYRQCNARINGKKTTGDKAVSPLTPSSIIPSERER
ncbi:hypothetical protein J6590_009173 [Homalodisca vitripennis]|nr:hypothetical protein J6590_009173 [Homalodisca vitripennis]